VVNQARSETEVNALERVLLLSFEERAERGLVHTPKEIAQQPATWASTFALFQERSVEIRKFLSRAGIGENSDRRPIVFLVGAGTSDYIGRSLVEVLRRMWQTEVVAVPSTDLLTHMAQHLVPGQTYIWISFSRSGDSPEGVAVLERALKYSNIHHLIVTCNQNGRILKLGSGQELALGICLPDEVNDRGLAMTSSFSNMVVFGQCLAHASDPDEYEATLQRIIAAGKSFVPAAADCAALLAASSYSKVCFVGSGPLAAVARESALKLLELTAGETQTMWESSLGLRHGPMAALKPDDLFVCFLSSDDRVQKYELDLLSEIGRKELVSARVVVGGTQKANVNGLAEHYLAPGIPSALPDEYRPPVDVIFGQLLGLFSSMRWNLKPDCPSPTGAISRVVRGVKIY
jgi:tagatose-6-phosphate ketose/aldose isomerase